MRLFRVFLFSILILTAPTLQAQTRHSSRPLAYLSTDSVFTMGNDCTNFRATASNIDPTILPRDFRLPDIGFKKMLKNWEKEDPGKDICPPEDGNEGTDARIERELRVQDKAAALFLHTGDRKYMDRIEYGIYNDVLHCTQTCPPGISKSIAAHILADATNRIYALTDSSIWVNLFVNSTARIPYKGRTIILDQLTAMPFSGRVRLRLTSIPQGGIDLRLYVRIPSWAEKSVPKGNDNRSGRSLQTLPPFYINGREPLQYDYKDGYVSISRKWRNGDELLLELPVSPRYVAHPHPGQQETVSVFCGPLLYVANDRTEEKSGDHSPILPSLTSLQENADEEGFPFYEGTYASGSSFTLHPYAIEAGRTSFRHSAP